MRTVSLNLKVVSTIHNLVVNQPHKVGNLQFGDYFSLNSLEAYRLFLSILVVEWEKNLAAITVNCGTFCARDKTHVYKCTVKHTALL